MTTTEQLDWRGHAQRLADLLWEHGDIDSPEWHAAMVEVPRHVFTPRVYDQDHTGRWISWDGADNLARVYSPNTLVTALADRGGYQEPVSSSTNPTLMMRMLAVLDPQPGDRVLEVGTGTGYNAALMCHRLGDRNVCSVDIDRDLVDGARGRLESIGYRPTLAATDGDGGLPSHAPFDRIIATCAVPAIPRAWVEQVAANGTVLTDFKLAISAGNLVHLQQMGDVVEGRFLARRASFMQMRHDDAVQPAVARANGGRERRRQPGPAQPWRDIPVVWFLAQLELPRGVVYGMVLDQDTREPSAATLTAPDGSWASIDLSGDTVTEAGDTDVWGPVERAYRLWLDADRPGWDRLGLTVTGDGEHRLWIDDPHGPLSWPLPS
ncbi:methyltransferase domain-containing protein [Amycolatopsis thermophila]|uniref:Protein-L-isoaspartate O-methyltransferase n=1 Tax=Amycolatopsis thermophila TaxID=206084 RepID=A0ABU0EMF2_9PSEU|nr:methyltransferase domain-containing protein [Amycolatopsis thermophila]MDQ0376473.1 protein-L-isoaspartate(D-aspartate) O-methyltransferase [Amycolatopsis thermophila]